MYTREQAALLRQAFWTALGKYLAPQRSADGLKTHWLNYRTGFKHLYFRLQADHRTASIAIEITHPDAEVQELFFGQLVEWKEMLHETLGEEWEWALHTRDENGKVISRIYQVLSPVNVFNQDDWPALISFFKPRLIALDAFWTNARYSFDSLR